MIIPELFIWSGPELELELELELEFEPELEELNPDWELELETFMLLPELDVEALTPPEELALPLEFELALPLAKLEGSVSLTVSSSQTSTIFMTLLVHFGWHSSTHSLSSAGFLKYLTAHAALQPTRHTFESTSMATS